MDDLKVKISALKDDALVEMLDDLYECLYVTGFTKEDSFLRYFISSNNISTFDDVQKVLLDVAVDRFGKIFYLLLNNRMCSFVKPIGR